MKTCKTEGEAVVALCPRMEERLNDSPHQKGLCRLVLTVFHEDRHWLAGVFYRKTPRDNGVLLNHCPWCGQSLIPPALAARTTALASAAEEAP